MIRDVIINADDFGFSETVNYAISLCFEKELIQRTTIMTNMPYFEDAVRRAEIGGFKNKVGLHLVLDEFTPLTNEIKKNNRICKDGIFIKGWPGSLKNKIYLSLYDINCLKTEIEAQMQAYCDAGFTLMHVDSHHLAHTSSPFLFNIIKKISLSYGFKSMRNVSIYPHDNLISRLAKKYINSNITKNFETTSLFAAFNDYESGLNDVEYMAHPDMVNDEIVDVINRRISQFVKFEKH